ncbi:NADP-dependent oxidoreductase [Antribacter sp. KLBMP9083]|uniref:NADP-dependent oxidoreductase n=1 Tax=Antribacter soli TaxID=2910976 RepID=A0AA41QI40_9MICO|nr:NADP-dependent oxidoreductase [Antribacter soli]MCF4119684.1 NADP-dependent oxidoreductase [Antribacter soli]MCF4123446.1 NADP-dependent oxidoreductase [Antribacter soli]
MKAVVVTDFGTHPLLTDLPMPKPGPGELLVRIHAAGVNPFDWKVADGALRDAVPHAFPLVMGSDGAGVVVETGPGVTRFRPGDRVYGQFMSLPQGHGSYAEYTLADQDGKIARIPESVPFTLAAALPTASVTAYQAVEAARLEEGHTFLINGASGGVGQSAIQFAARAGARVLATGTPDLADHLRDLGAHAVIDFTVAPTHEQVAAAHPEGIDAVLDLVTPTGGDTSPMAGLLRAGATLVSTNFATDPGALAARDILGVNLGNSPTAETLSALAELAASGELRVRIDAEVPLHEAPATIAKARTGHSTGKTVIVP